MTPPRQIAVTWGPRLLAAMFFAVCAYVFSANLTPAPRYRVQTDLKLDRWSGTTWGGSVRASVEHVSDDGGLVVVGVRKGLLEGSTTLQAWDTRTGANRTPTHWNDPDWYGQMDRRVPHSWRHSRLIELTSNRAGRDLLFDDAAWPAILERLAIRRAHRSSDPPEIEFSPDGGLIAYTTRNGCPIHLISEKLGDGTRIDDTRTGRLVATLPGVTGSVTIAPDGRTAVARNSPEEREGELPWLSLWDLETSTRRADLFSPSPIFDAFYSPVSLFPRSPISDVKYSPDSRYVVAWSHRPDLMRWWDVSTGKQVAEIDHAREAEFVDGGRLLVAQSADHLSLQFWDVATGRELDEWDLPRPRGAVGRVGRLLPGRHDRYLVAEVEPDPELAGPPPGKVVDWLIERLPERHERRSNRRVVLLDAIDRRVVGHVPGVSAAVSDDGRWLAALDEEGVVRVYPVPIGRA